MQKGNFARHQAAVLARHNVMLLDVVLSVPAGVVTGNQRAYHRMVTQLVVPEGGTGMAHTLLAKLD